MINGLPSWTMSTAVEAFFNKCLAGNLRNISFWMLQRSRGTMASPWRLVKVTVSHARTTIFVMVLAMPFGFSRIYASDITQAKNAKLLSAEDRWRTIEAEWEAAVENEPIARAPQNRERPRRPVPPRNP